MLRSRILPSGRYMLAGTAPQPPHLRCRRTAGWGRGRLWGGSRDGPGGSAFEKRQAARWASERQQGSLVTAAGQCCNSNPYIQQGSCFMAPGKHPAPAPSPAWGTRPSHPARSWPAPSQPSWQRRRAWPGARCDRAPATRPVAQRNTGGQQISLFGARRSCCAGSAINRQGATWIFSKPALQPHDRPAGQLITHL